MKKGKRKSSSRNISSNIFLEQEKENQIIQSLFFSQDNSFQLSPQNSPLNLNSTENFKDYEFCFNDLDEQGNEKKIFKTETSLSLSVVETKQQRKSPRSPRKINSTNSTTHKFLSSGGDLNSNEIYVVEEISKVGEEEKKTEILSKNLIAKNLLIPKEQEEINLTPKESNMIPGLYLIENFITREEHNFLINEIDQQPWKSDLKRRVQHYGWTYDYQGRKIDSSSHLGPLPSFCSFLLERFSKIPQLQEIRQSANVTKVFDQLIVNGNLFSFLKKKESKGNNSLNFCKIEYQPGMGITFHVDKVNWFADGIISLSLGSACIMDFKSVQTKELQQVFLPIRSLILLTKEARYEWQHSIQPRKMDVWKGMKVDRARRVSLTFRLVLEESLKPPKKKIQKN